MSFVCGACTALLRIVDSRTDLKTRSGRAGQPFVHTIVNIRIASGETPNIQHRVHTHDRFLSTLLFAHIVEPIGDLHLSRTTTSAALTTYVHEIVADWWRVTGSHRVFPFDEIRSVHEQSNCHVLRFRGRVEARLELTRVLVHAFGERRLHLIADLEIVHRDGVQTDHLLFEAIQVV